MNDQIPFATPAIPEQLAVAPDGSFVFVNDRDYNISLFRPDGSLIRRLPETLPLTAPMADGKTLAAYKKGHFLSYSLPDGKQISERETSDVVWFLGSGRGDVLIGCCPHKYTLGNEDWTVRLWQYPGGKELGSFEVQGTDMYETVLSADGSMLAWGGRQQVVHVWDCRVGKELAHFDNEKGKSVRLAFSPDSKYLATGGAKNHVYLWDLKTKKLVHRFDGDGEEQINALAFAPDGSILASGGDDRIVSFWDVKGGKLLRRTAKPAQRTGAAYPNVESIAFFPNGKTIVTGHNDEALRLWDVSTAKEITPRTKGRKD
jgi:WD40 repeat protein